MPELRGVREVENAAIAWVLTLEREAGREPIDVRSGGSAGDIESPPRTIEVKAIGLSARGNDLPLEVPQFLAAQSNPDFYLYVVDNVRQGDPDQFQLRVIGGERLQRMLRRAKEHRYFTVSWPVAEYDGCPLGLDL